MKEQKRVFQKINKINEKTELATQRVEFKLGDSLPPLIDKAEKIRSKLNSDLDREFSKIRQVEKLLSNLESGIFSIKEYTNAVQKVEVAWQKEVQKLKNIEEELGEKVGFPKSMSKALQDMKFLQEYEEDLRGDINEYNAFMKKHQ